MILQPFILFLSVEDPSEDFVRLRDFVDAKNCFSQLSTMVNLEAVSGGFTEDMTKEEVLDKIKEVIE